MTLENRHLANEYYTQAEHGDFELFDLGDFELASGQRLPDCTLAYQTHGKLNQEMFFPVSDCAHEESMIPDSELRPIPSLWGHFTMFGVFEEDKKAIDDNIRELLETPV